MSRVVRFYETRRPEVLRVEDAIQQPDPGEVLLQVQAIGLNRADCMFMHGKFFEGTRLPGRSGYEAVGVVKEVGPQVDSCWRGKRTSARAEDRIYLTAPTKKQQADSIRPH